MRSLRLQTSPHLNLVMAFSDVEVLRVLPAGLPLQGYLEREWARFQRGAGSGLRLPLLVTPHLEVGVDLCRGTPRHLIIYSSLIR